MFEKKKLAEDVLMYRALKNISQQELADQCKVSRDIIVKIENETANLRKVTYKKISNVIYERGQE